MMDEKQTKTLLDTLGVHPSNLVHIVFGIWLWFYVAVPTWDFVSTYIDGFNKVDELIMQDNVRMQEELVELREMVKNQMNTRRAGHVGITYH